MRIGFKEAHWTDENNMPSGGCSYGTGFCVSWQNGPLGRGDERVEPNGAFVEDIIAMARGRIEFYQVASHGRFACAENEAAIAFLNKALEALNSRTKRREQSGIEGTHKEE